MKFQLERILLFSDAVFAIAITLMMIEVKPPHLHGPMPFREALNELLKLTPTFIGTIQSFVLIGLFWTHHHRLMQHVTAYNSKFLWMNLMFLLTITFIPFSTSFVFENPVDYSPLPMLVYNLNFIVATLLSFSLFSYALNPQNGLCEAGPQLDGVLQRMRVWTIVPIIVYVSVIIIAFLRPSLSPLGYMLFGLSPIINRRAGKKKEAQTEGITEPVSEEPALVTAQAENGE
jgi:uncharacterized membrane protein